MDIVDNTEIIDLGIFQVTAGSVMGSHHRALFRNNQDAYRISQTPDAIIAILADGCGSGRYSEVGARLAPGFIAKRLNDPGLNFLDKNYVALKVAVNDLQNTISDIVAGQVDEPTRCVNDMFLFTLLGAIITPELTYIFAFGDGAYMLNGELTILDQDNTPNYIGYGCIKPQAIKANHYRTIPTAEVRSLILGCDGVLDIVNQQDTLIRVGTKEELIGGLSQFLTLDDVALGKRLNVLSKQGVLTDDTTLIVIKDDSIGVE